MLTAVIVDRGANAAVVSAWVDRWRPLATAAVEAFAAAVARAPVPLDPAQATARIDAAVSDELGAVRDPPRGDETAS